MEFSPGLRGVIAGETSISTVGKEGTSLRYRGYDAIELTKNNTYEEVASLIIKDSLDGDVGLTMELVFQETCFQMILIQ